MNPKPESLQPGMQGCDRLMGRTALVTGGDSGIGRAVAASFAREGADVAFFYLEEERDARETVEMIESFGGKGIAVKVDIGREHEVKAAVEDVVERLGKLDILVNNAAEQHVQQSILDITAEQLEATFRTNIFSMFYLCQAALPHLRKSDFPSIINTTSVTAYRGSPGLVDYSATKGSIVSFTRSLSGQLAGEKIRVNAVAPGPIWTPLIPATFPADEVAKFGSSVPLGRAGQPWECAECYVFLASRDASYVTGQVIHPNGGEIING